MADRSLNLGTLFTADIRQFLAQTARIRAELNKMGAAFQAGAKGGKAMGDQTAAGIGKVDKSVKKSTKGVQEYSKQIGKVEGAWKRVLAAMKVTASYGLAATGIFSVVQALKAGVTEIIDFDQALKNLQAITRATDNEVIGMGETIKDVAEKTKFSTGEVAEGMVLLGQAGFSATESMQSMQAVANLATGTLSNLKTTSDLLTTAIRAFGLETVESSRVADVMANAINRSKLTLDKLRISFNFVGAAAAQTGLSLEETAAAMMVLANHGIRASTIGTGMRQVLARLLAPNRRLREEFEAQGIELSKVNPKLVGFQTAMKNMIPILFDAERGAVDMGKAYRLFGLRGAQAAAILTKAFAGTGAGSFQDMLDKTFEVGAAARMAATQMEGLGVKIKNLADRAKLIAVAFGEGGAIGVMKLFIDTLRALAKGIADFLGTGIGRLATGFTVWSTSIWLTIHAIRGLSVLVVALSKNLKTLAVSLRLVWVQMVAMQAASGASILSFKGMKAGASALWATLSKLKGTWVLVAAAIGAAVAAIRFWMGTQERAVRKAVELQQKQEQVVQSLKVYTGALKELALEQDKGKDITREHAGLVARLGEEYKALSYTLSQSADDVVKNSVLTQRAYRLELKKSIIATSELAKEQKKLLDETVRWQGFITELKKFGGVLVGVLQDIGGIVVSILKWVAELGIKIIDTIDKVLRKINPLLGFFINLGSKGLKQIVKFFDTFSERMKKSGAESEKAKKQMEDLTKTYVTMAEKLKETFGDKITFDEIIKRIEKMQDIKLSPEQIAEIDKVLNAVTVKLEKATEDWEKSLGKLPKSFQEMFQKLGPIQKVEFAKMVKQMEDEIASSEDRIKILTGKEEEFHKVRAAIRAKYLAKFAADMAKETKTKEESLQDQISIIQEYVEKENEEYEKRLEERENMFEKELLIATGNEEETTRVKQEHLEKRALLDKVHQDTILGYQSVINQKRAELESELSEKILKANIKTTKGIIGELKKRQSEVQKEAEDFRKTSLDFEKKGQDQALEIRRQGLSEEGKWRSIREQRDDVLRRARATKDKELFEKSLELTKQLATEVKNENGEVVRSLEENSKRFGQQYEAIAKNAALTFKNLADDRKKESEDIEKTLENMKALLKAYRTEVDATKTDKLELQADEAMSQLEAMYDWVTKFREEWDKIKPKTVTLNVITTGGGAVGGGSVETRVDKDLEDYFSDIDTMRKGGVVKAKVKQVKEVIHRRVGGWASRAVGKIRGYGGGDIVKAMLEPGEYVARKEAVKKYGPDFFEGLNKMTVPQTIAEAAGAPQVAPASASVTGDGGDGGGVAAKIGGLIKEIRNKAFTSNTKIIKLRKGGSVVNYVRSAGARVHSSLSNISYTTNSRTALVAARTGGLISAASPSPVTVKMQGGGVAPSIKRDGNVFNISISPKYMTGDRRSMRQAAVEIKRELEALGVRWGK
jgi:TP901 family phage tail tape measure protein